MSPEQIREPAMLERVADSLRRMHDGPAIPGVFVPLRIVEGYRAGRRSRRADPPAYDRAREAGHRIERALLASLSIAPLPQRPAQRQLHRRRERLRIVDWEYAGMGDPFFDLGNFSINHELPPEADEALLRAYDGEVRPPRLARLTLMRVVSDFREAMWSVLQQGISSLDFDFVAYADEPFERLLGERAAPAFERALQEAADG